jgi:hypothetical protein
MLRFPSWIKIDTPFILCLYCSAKEPSMNNKATIAGRSAYELQSRNITIAVTEEGAHMAPVSFFTDTANPVQPYYISPWQEEDPRLLEGQPPVLRSLRGDFFCLPFGGNALPPDGGSGAAAEEHPPHGETAGSPWALVEARQSGGAARMVLRMDTKVRPGTVEAQWFLTGQDNCIYNRHIISGMEGPAPLGHHATLSIDNGPLNITTSPLQFGMTNPYSPPYSQGREYYALAPGARFEELTSVPTIWKDPAFTDCSVFPAREGFIDILQLFQENSDEPAWLTAHCREGSYIWFSLKNRKQLPSTVIWMENHGRHGAPWNGRNACIGLEDVCAYFADGLAASVRPNLLGKAGISTAHTLSAGQPMVVSYIQGVVRVDPDFDQVERIEFTKSGMEIVSTSGRVVPAAVKWEFLDGAELG